MYGFFHVGTISDRIIGVYRRWVLTCHVKDLIRQDRATAQGIWANPVNRWGNGRGGRP